jgi:hypothetical protein
VPTQAAATGVAASAAQLAGSLLVSPWDVGRIAVGAGSGLFSGLLVGKMMRVLTGLTPAAAEQLQRAGVWAGVVNAITPMAYGAGR